MTFRVRERGASGIPKNVHFQNSNWLFRNPKDVAAAPNGHVRNPNRLGHPTPRRAGNRGVTHLPWRCGPREPPSLVDVRYQFLCRRYSWNYTSLFVDGLPRNYPNYCLKKLFSMVAVVFDSFVSRKRRPHKTCAFGFVRLRSRREALKVIKSLNGFRVEENIIRVSFAKFDRNGKAFFSGNENRTLNCKPNHAPVYSDARRPADALKNGQRNGTVDKVEHGIGLSVSSASNMEKPTKVTEQPQSQVAVEHEEGMGLKNDMDVDSSEVSSIIYVTPGGSDCVMEEKDSSSSPVAMDKQSDTKSSNEAEIKNSSSQPRKCANTFVAPTKKPRSVLLNSRAIADYLGYYTKSPVPAAITQKS
ncbi:unnamed protein product [Amaranthus hypochondriacus]